MRFAGGLCLLIALLTFAGWKFDITSLKSVMSGWVPTKANTALGLLLAGISFLVFRTSSAGSVWRDRFVIFTAAFLFLLGNLTISEYVFHWDMGIDRFLFPDAPVVPRDLRPGRMSPTTAFTFILLGCALWLMIRGKGAPRLRQPLLAGTASAIGLIALLVCLGYVLEAVFGMASLSYTGMALPTAVSFLLLGGGALALVQGEGGFVWSLGRTITLGFVVAILVLLISAITSQSMTTRLAESVLSVTNVRDILKEIGTVSAALDNLESSQRGYIILGDESLLDSRPQSKMQVRESLGRLVALTLYDPRRKANIDALMPLITRRIDFGEKTIALRRQAGFEAARRELASRIGINLSAEIKTIIERMRSEELGLLGRRKLTSDATTMTTFLILPMGVFVGLALLSCAVFLLNAGIAERKKAELRAAYQARLLSHVSDAIIATDNNLRIMAWNLAAERLYGYTEAEVLGGYVSNFVRSDMSEAERAELLRQLTESGSARLEIVQYDRHGRELDIEARTMVIHDENKNITGIVSVNRDVSERKRAEEELAASEIRFRALIENSHDGLSLSDAELKTIYRSPGSHKISGDNSDKFSVFGVVHADDVVVRDEIIAQALKSAGKPLPFELRVRHAGGHYIWIEGTVTNFLQRRGVNALVTNYRDITVRKLAEERIQSMTSELEQRVLERTRELSAANKELEAFSYSVSHDLRAPLRGIDGWSLALLEDYGKALDDAGRGYIGRVRSEAQRMGVLIDDMLKLSQVTRAEMQRTPVDMTALAATIAARLSQEDPGRQVEFVIAPGMACDADGALLEIALANLMGNAFKFSGKKATARIEVGVLPKGDAPEYFVRDNGAGFDMAHARKLFGAFQRMHRASEFSGTGIGLATVRRIINRHGGTLRAEAAVNEGATFYFTLGEAA